MKAAISINSTVKQLGYAGLLPFFGLALASHLLPSVQHELRAALASYAFAIICFLVGSWWGMALIRKNVSGLVLSNVITLVVVAGSIMLTTQQFLLFEMLVLQALWLVESIFPLFKRQPDYYRRMRMVLSVSGGVCLVMAALD